MSNVIEAVCLRLYDISAKAISLNLSMDAVSSIPALIAPSTVVFENRSYDY